MINERIHPLRIATAIIELMRDDLEAPRMSLLDLQILLMINESSELGKMELLHLMQYPTTGKSSLDRPISRLMLYGLVEQVDHSNAATRSGQPRRTYKISKAGHKLLTDCGR